MKVSLITNSEIKQLRAKTDKTDCEELVHKLHSSYNAVIIHMNDLKDRNNNLVQYEKENVDLKDKLNKKISRIAFLNSEIDRYKRMLNTKEKKEG